MNITIFYKTVSILVEITKFYKSPLIYTYEKYFTKQNIKRLQNYTYHFNNNNNNNNIHSIHDIELDSV